jgi:Cu/Ag efflux pump CusA
LINTPSGDFVKLAKVANISIKSTPTIIKREGMSKFIDIKIISERGDKKIISKKINNLIQEFNFSLEYYGKIIDNYENNFYKNIFIIIIFLVGMLLIFQAIFSS